MKPRSQIFLLLLLLVSLRGYCDDGQPGIFHGGGITDLRSFYPQDSNALRKIQVLNEKIAIQLYRGFAVVKGEYKMLNTSGDSLSLKVGYPVNSSFTQTGKDSVIASIFFDPLYALKSYANGREHMLTRTPVDSLHALDDNNWYVWADTFKPRDTTIITVYFIVNTNNAEVVEGTKKDANNAFLYLMETASTFRQPIVNGEIKIELMDDLKMANIRGFLPTSVFKIDDERNVLVYKFSNLTPQYENNVVLVYTPNIAAFDFSYVSQRRLALFGSIDAFFQQSDDEFKLTDHTFDSPYAVRKVKWTSLLNFGLLIGGSIFGLILIVWLFKLLIRFLKGQRPQRGREM